LIAWTVLLHDIGKAPCQRKKEERITFYDHELVGAEMAMAILLRLKASEALIDDVTLLIKEHMKLASVTKMKDSTFKRLLNMKLKTEPQNDRAFIQALAELNWLDSIASNCDFSDYEYTIKRMNNTPDGVEKIRRLITGDDLIRAGFIQGPQFRKILEEAYKAQLEGAFSSKEDALLWLIIMTKIICK
jgi:poly(A) polymerase